MHPPIRPGALLVGVAAAASLVVPASSDADCSTTGAVHINEVRFHDTESPEEERLNALVELYNDGASPIGLGSWSLRDESGATRATLPALSLPGAAHLVVIFASGTNDLDFSDSIGTVYAGGDSVDVFDHWEGAVALYNSSSVIQDFVTWSLGGSPPPGPSLTAAIAAGLWTAGDFVRVVEEQQFFTIRLVPDGYEFNRGTDWYQLGWGDSQYGALVAGPNQLALGPANATGFDPGPITFGWAAHDSAVGYRLEVATDSTFAGGIEVDVTTTSTDTTLTLPTGTHWWRVRLVDSCGITGDPPPRWVTVFPFPARSGTLGPATARLGAPRRMQRKDSRLLCIYQDGDNGKPVQRRPGCAETANWTGPWDDSHPADHAERQFVVVVWGHPIVVNIQCPHCRWYCGRAAAQMINNHYAGTLTQDRISYDLMRVHGSANNAAPEGDLGHDQGSKVAHVGPNLQWAIENSAVTGPFVANYGALKGEINAGFPSFVVVPGHAMVVDGFMDANANAPGDPPADLVHILDPWPTSIIDGWTSFAASNIKGFWKLRQPGVPALTGRAQEATVTTDTDNDGVMDFDEGAPNYPADRPRQLGSRHNKNDTDDDWIKDKKEIRSYTFHDTDHAGHENDALGFADVDGDGKRTEADCDSDGDKDADGNEDINVNGIGPEAGETCVFDAASKNLALTLNQQACGAQTRPVIGGGTMMALQEFNVTVIAGACVDPAADAALPDHGDVTTGANGNVTVSFVQCQQAGPVVVVIDAVANGKFDPGCDPVLCGNLGAVGTPLASGVPENFEIRGATPNPFDHALSVALDVPRESRVSLAVYDVAGRKVSTIRDGTLPADRHVFWWNGISDDGEPLASGMYWLRAEAGGEVRTRKVIKLE